MTKRALQIGRETVAFSKNGPESAEYPYGTKVTLIPTLFSRSLSLSLSLSLSHTHMQIYPS
jgi:hypothetical protein